MIVVSARCRLSIVLVLVAVVVPTAVTVAGAATPTPSSTPTALHSGVVVAGRFVSEFSLDGGKFVVSPEKVTSKSVMIPSSVLAEVSATSQVSGYRLLALGAGIVTFAGSSAGVPPVHAETAFVALLRNVNTYYCPAETGPPRHLVTPTSSGWAAVVIAGSTSLPSVVYRARSVVCSTIQPAHVENAALLLSVPWYYHNAHVAVRMPSCARWQSTATGSYLNKAPDMSVYVTRFIDHSLAACQRARVVLDPGGFRGEVFVTTTTHGVVGPVRRVVG